MQECRHTDGISHNCGYVDARNALIPRAADLANMRVGKAAPSGSWSQAFVLAMQELALGAGLVANLDRPPPKEVLVHGGGGRRWPTTRAV